MAESVLRTFIGIDCELPEILEYQQRTFADLRPVSPIHITLKFLDMCTPKQTRDIIACLQKVHAQAFTLRTGNLMAFRKPQTTKILMLSIEHNRLLLTLQQKINKTLTGLYEPDSKYVPHLTLARCAQPVGIETYTIPPKFVVKLSAFYLYQKDETYAKIRRFNLI